MFKVTTIPITPDQKRARTEHRRNYSRMRDRSRDRQPSRERAAQIAQQTRLTAKVRAFMLLGGACETCKNNDMRVLDVDHIHNNGADERRRLAGNKRSCSNIPILNRVLEAPFDYQLLCANCHRIRHFDGKYRRLQHERVK